MVVFVSRRGPGRNRRAGGGCGIAWACSVAAVIMVMIILLMPDYAEGKGYSYKKGDEVIVYVNKIGPYWNPSETYDFYSLPTCRPDHIKRRGENLAQVLKGDRMAHSLYTMNYMQDIESEKVCKVSLTQEVLDKLKYSVEKLYYFELVIDDDYPLRNFLGYFHSTDGLSYNCQLWTHYSFIIQYNKDRIVNATLLVNERDPVVLEHAGQVLEFTYSVKWVPTETTQRAISPKFFPQKLEVHWLSIMNSCLLVAFLIGFVMTILTNVLKKDFNRYSRAADDLDDFNDVYGWKLVAGDVFRIPPYSSVFCAFLGVGTQFLAMGVTILVLALSNVFNTYRHDSINSAAVVLYAITSFVAGYVSGYWYRKLGGERWTWNLVLTAITFAGPFFLVWSVMNSVAWAYQSTQALPYTTVIILLVLWIGVGFPLNVVGGIIGKNRATPFDPPCRTKNIPREIPYIPFWRSATVEMIIGGFLPFCSISIELYYIHSALWGQEAYTLYGILAIVFLICLLATASIAVALTYNQLSLEDHCWWWRSMFNVGILCVFFVMGTFNDVMDPEGYPELPEEDLQRLYTWIDEVPLSRKKKNIGRDFADAVLVAEIVHHFMPRMVDLHNYPSACSTSQKYSNWQTLNHKVLRKLGFTVSDDFIKHIVSATPGAIEIVLNNLHIKIDKVLEEQAYEKYKKDGNERVQPYQYLRAVNHKDGKPNSAAESDLEDMSCSQSYISCPPSKQSHHPQPQGMSAFATAHNQEKRSAMAMQKQQSFSQQRETPYQQQGPPTGYNNNIVSGGGDQSQPRATLSYVEKDQLIQDLGETVDILDAKVKKLEQLVNLKERRVEELTRRMREHGLKP
eukprot:Nk52_evm31s288 gene=Nk52_evmTU31s288